MPIVKMLLIAALGVILLVSASPLVTLNSHRDIGMSELISLLVFFSALYMLKES